MKNNRSVKGFFIVISGMMILSAALLLVLSALFWKMDVSARVVSGGVILIYVISCFLGGFVIGKVQGTQKFFWGFTVGLCYFALLFVTGELLFHTKGFAVTSVVGCAISCIVSGMFGGMLAPGKKI